METTQTEARIITLENITNNLHRLTSTQAEGVALLLNSKVPANDAISSEVQDIVGLTMDGQVFYAGAGNYWLGSFETVRAHLQKSIEEERVEFNRQEVKPMFSDSLQRTAIEAREMDQMVSRGIYERLRYKEATLAHLEQLKTAYDARQARRV